MLSLSGVGGATRALREVVDAAQQDDPLASVTVVAPSAYAALWLRRELPRSEAGGGGALANVRFGTLDELAAVLSAPAMAERGVALADPTAQYAALRSVAAPSVPPAGQRLGGSAPERLPSAGPAGSPSEPGGPGAPWGPPELAAHPRTQQQLMAAMRALGGLTPASRRRLGDSSPAARPLLAAFEQWCRVLEGVHLVERSALYGMAAEAAGMHPAGCGHVVVHLPADLDLCQEQLLEALVAAGRCSMLLAATGDAACDAALRRLARRCWGSSARRAPAPCASPPCDGAEREPERAGAVFEAPDSDVEVREVLAQIGIQLSNGVRPDRMAVLHPPGSGYERLLTDRLTEAAIPFAARNPRRLYESRAGRCVLGALELATTELRRDAVCDFLAGIPVVEAGIAAPVAAWGRLSREAGIVSGAGQWDRRLSALVRALSDDPERRADAAAAVRLRDLVVEVSHLLAELRLARTWPALAGTATSVLRLLLGGSAERSAWSERELSAGEAVEAALGRLSRLDDLDPGPNLNRFKGALAVELRQRQLHQGSVGGGIAVAPWGGTLGMEFDLTFVVGASGSTLPRPEPHNPFLSGIGHSAVRPAPAGEVTWARHHYLCALDATRLSVRSYARGSLRDEVVDGPSRWLEAGTVRTRATARSFAEWLEACRSSEGRDADLRSLWRWHRSGRSLEEHPDARPRRWFQALAAARARGAHEFGAFDGWVEDASDPGGSNSSPLSPTSLEQYARCPRRYMLSHVLNVRALDAPEDLLTMSPRDRGTMIHEILQRFVSELVTASGGDGRAARNGAAGGRDDPAAGEPVPPPAVYSSHEGGPGSTERLLEIAEGVFAEYQRQGSTGKAALWEAEQSLVRDQLLQIASIDARRRTEWTPVAVERSFGFGGERAFELPLPSGRTLQFRGYVDRVDRSRRGGLAVLDYKTGAAETQKSLENDPVAAGQKLQLAIYGLAMAERFGAERVWSGYWFVSDRGRYELVGYEVGSTVRERLAEVLDVLAGSIGKGLFPVRPGKPGRGTFDNCSMCDYDRCCSSDRDRSWEVQRAHPSLHGYVSLVEVAEQ